MARTTHDQYGEVLHTYTIKNALEDGSVLGFQVEHENTVEPTSLENKIYRKLKEVETYADYSSVQIMPIQNLIFEMAVQRNLQS